MSDQVTECDLCGYNVVVDPIEVELPQIGKPFVCGAFCEACAKLIHDAYRESCAKKGIQP